MKKLTIGIAAMVLFLTASTALAELYEWKDRDGVVHLTDRLNNVPEEYRATMKVYGAAPGERVETPEAETVKPSEGAGEAGTEPAPLDLYGDQPLEWWVDAFKAKKAEISAVESDMKSKNQFISVFESGRKFGQVFDQKDVDTYEKYKVDLAADEEKLAGLKEELSDLRSKATRAGVPRAVRE